MMGVGPRQSPTPDGVSNAYLLARPLPLEVGMTTHRRDRDHPWNDFDYQAVLDRTGVFCRHRGSHPGYNARDVFVSGLCRQTFRKIGGDGARCHYPHRRLLRLRNGGRSDF